LFSSPFSLFFFFSLLFAVYHSFLYSLSLLIFLSFTASIPLLLFLLISLSLSFSLYIFVSLVFLSLCFSVHVTFYLCFSFCLSLPYCNKTYDRNLRMITIS
jgi:hypothetical protein